MATPLNTPNFSPISTAPQSRAPSTTQNILSRPISSELLDGIDFHSCNTSVQTQITNTMVPVSTLTPVETAINGIAQGVLNHSDAPQSRTPSTTQNILSRSLSFELDYRNDFVPLHTPAETSTNDQSLHIQPTTPIGTGGQMTVESLDQQRYIQREISRMQAQREREREIYGFALDDSPIEVMSRVRLPILPLEFTIDEPETERNYSNTMSPVSTARSPSPFDSINSESSWSFDIATPDLSRSPSN